MSAKKIIQKIMMYFLAGCLFSQAAASQELYVFSEPASNMPSNSLSAKLTYRSPVSQSNTGYKQRYTPELMFGVNKKWMLHLSSSFSDFYTAQVRWESVKTYAKCRFYSNDDIHQHFRMAAFGEASWSRNPFYYGDINLDGENSGIQAGIIATQLINKLAVSGTSSVIKVFASAVEHASYPDNSSTAFYYSLSAGYLLLPFNYSDYKQTNLNLYFETIGMKGLDKGGYMLDLAPALQLIFNSNFKVNLGARFQVTGDMVRVGEKNYFISLERTFLGALHHKKK
ncbi:MAG: hypothetical protein ABUT20_47325, partial [Bacteroidota bacterium]